MTRLPSHYVPLHAIAAGAVLISCVWKDFAEHFLHGIVKTPPTTAGLLLMILVQTALFVTLAVILWGSTFITRRLNKKTGETQQNERQQERVKYGKALKYTLFAFPGICLVAFGLEAAESFVCKNIFGLELAEQDIIKWLSPGIYPLWVRLILFAMILVEAPLVEEWLFRGIVFRGLLKWNGLWAFVLSGLLFALIHVNAATVLPLFYLGVAFAWLYWKTRTILAPMLAHFLFNLTNLIACLFIL